MSFTEDVETAFAQLLVGGGVGVYHADGSAYAVSDLGITHKRLSDQPPRQMALTHYPVNASPANNTYQGAVQVRTRGSEVSGDVDGIADLAYQVLHGLEMVTSNGITFTKIWWQSGASLGADSSGQGRWQRSDNFYYWAARPTTALPE